jgi:hypothetical protein
MHLLGHGSLYLEVADYHPDRNREEEADGRLCL